MHLLLTHIGGKHHWTLRMFQIIIVVAWMIHGWVFWRLLLFCCGVQCRWVIVVSYVALCSFTLHAAAETKGISRTLVWHMRVSSLWLTYKVGLVQVLLHILFNKFLKYSILTISKASLLSSSRCWQTIIFYQIVYLPIQKREMMQFASLLRWQ